MAEYTARWTAECIDWKNSREPYSRYEQEQINFVLSKPWPPQDFVIRSLHNMYASHSPRYANERRYENYNHSLSKELYNACGISDRETDIHICTSNA